jgi:hypothetical protein
VRIAFTAASRRVGSTSLARIEPETSTTRTTVPLFSGTESRAFGRASAVDAHASATSSSASGTQGRQARRSRTRPASSSRFVNATG